MMGSRMQTAATFQYFCLDDWVPTDHLLRAIDRHVDFVHCVRNFVRCIAMLVGRLLIRKFCCGYC